MGRDRSWQRLLSHHLEAEAPDETDLWPRLEEELRWRQAAAQATVSQADGSRQEHRQSGWGIYQSRRLALWLPVALVGLVSVLLFTWQLPGVEPEQVIGQNTPGADSLLVPGGLNITTVVEASRHEWREGSEWQAVERHQWVTVTGLFRLEEQTLTGLGGQRLVQVGDGFDLWTEADGRITVEWHRPDESILRWKWGRQAVRYLAMLNEIDTCRQPVRKGRETVAGRSAHVIALSPTTCPRDESPGAHDDEVIWIDTETHFLLKRERTRHGNGELLERFEVTSLAFNADLGPDLFSYVPPDNAEVIDNRSTYRPNREMLTAFMRSAGAHLEIDLYLLGESGDLLPGWPQKHNNAVSLVYTPPKLLQGPSYPLSRGLVLVQRSAVASSLAVDPEPVLHGTAYAAMLRALTAGGTKVELIRDGTHITLMSPDLDEAELHDLAASLEPVPGYGN